MRIYLLLCSLITLIAVPANAQQLTGEELLDKAIGYHDPNNNWKSFSGELNITMTTPDQKERVSKVIINLPREYFKVVAKKDGDTTLQIIDKAECSLSLNGKADISDEEVKKHRLSCERAAMMKDYYTYLYGLPMKLKDKGTQIDPKVENKRFKGKEYLVLRATYDSAVGEDIWYFYFDPKSYAMEVYQFFHDESKNDGEYILLSGEEVVSGIKMPKTRAWYYNKDNKYLGTDLLMKAETLPE